MVVRSPPPSLASVRTATRLWGSKKKWECKTSQPPSLCSPPPPLPLRGETSPLDLGARIEISLPFKLDLVVQRRFCPPPTSLASRPVRRIRCSRGEEAGDGGESAQAQGNKGRERWREEWPLSLNLSIAPPQHGLAMRYELVPEFFFFKESVASSTTVRQLRRGGGAVPGKGCQTGKDDN